MPATRPPPADPQTVAATRARVARLAQWLDGFVRLPGTNFRLGLDSIVGLIPGVGDLAGLLLGGTILVESLRVGAPQSLLARMVSNLAIDALVGAVPVLGDLFDFAYKSHAKNARLLLDHLDAQSSPDAAPTARGGKLLVASILLAMAVLAGLAFYGLYALSRQLF